MKITIDYEASWRNSFLDGSNNQPIPKKGRDFIGSMTKLASDENYQNRQITIDTVLGVLNRLIGDQRKLYQIKQGLGGHKHYFEDIIEFIRFEDKPKAQSQEIAYIRNMSGNTDQNAFTGMIKVNDSAFQSDFSQIFWGILSLDFEKLCQFILENSKFESDIELNPISILGRLEEIKKMKAVEYAGNAKIASEKLASCFPKYSPFDNKGQLKLLPMYCSSLYLQLNRLEKHYDMSGAKSKKGGISGISNNGFTLKDFMDRYTTGPKKLIYGNPYVREEFVKGEGKIKHTLIKASGQMDIYLDVDLEKAIELKKMIDSAGVSSFYLGKKGLAYVSRIDVR
ncbi:type I-Fv CRISPR-associated protein Cas5fv [Legionella pneumophila serogroup 1]